MDIVLLALILLLLFILLYIIFNRDFFSPSVLFCFSYFISVVCCLYNAREWGADICVLTIILIIASILCFAFGEILVKSILNEKNPNNNYVEIDYINVPTYKTLIVIVFNTFITIFLYKEIVRIASINYENWGNLIYNFKTNSNNIEGAQVNNLVTQGLKISKAFAYIYGFIFINNLFATQNKNNSFKDFWYLIPIIFVIIQSLLKGVRIAIITLLFAMFFIWYIFMQIKNNWHLHFNFKRIIKICLISIIICTMFYYSKGLVGRLQKNTGVVKYVTTYLGGPIELLNLYVKDTDFQNNDDKVIETMGGLFITIQKIGLFSEYRINAVREYRNSETGYPLGNVYGAVRDYYHDLGIIGVIICFFIMSIWINIMYYIIKSRSGLNIKRPTLLIIYSTFVYAIFFLTFSDFITSKLAIGSLIEILFIIIGIKFLI